MPIALGLAGKKKKKKKKRRRVGFHDLRGRHFAIQATACNNLCFAWKRVDNSGPADQSMTIEEGKMNSRCACGSGEYFLFFFIFFFHIASKQSKGWLEPSFFSVSDAFDCQVVSHSKLAMR